jgi:hypothetical protein
MAESILDERFALCRWRRKIGPLLAAAWSLSVLSLSLLERGVLLERPAAVKGALLLRGEANP